MPKLVKAQVKPELLVWARDSSGLTAEEAAKKAGVKPTRLESWERGEARPTVNQVRNLGRIYKRPLAVFFLPEPPQKFQAMRDFRRLPGVIAGRESPQLRNEIRLARFRRETALDLHRLLDVSPPKFEFQANLTDDPEKTAHRLRELLGITYDEQVAWRTKYEALNRWRAALAEIGILVFQTRGIVVGEMRGFSISDHPLPVIAVNIKDAVRGRIFSLLHELAHLALREEGLCDIQEEAERPASEQSIEVFCNRVAGAILMPMDRVLGEDIVLAKSGEIWWSDQELTSLSNRYKASKEATLRRLLILGRTTNDFYRTKREEFQEEYQDRPSTTGGFPLPDRIAVSTAGADFVRLVLNSYYQEKITSSDVSDYLDVRLKHLPRIEAAVFGHRIAFGARE